jgi:transposase
MEACGTAHFWAREIAAFGHEVRLMPPGYVKPYVKRNKHDAADAEAVCEAVRRPSMRFVPIKTKEQQAALVAHSIRDLLVRQRTMLVKCISFRRARPVGSVELPTRLSSRTSMVASVRWRERLEVFHC